MSDGELMQEIITHNSMRSFTMGTREGVIKERIRIMEIIQEHKVSATTADGNYTVESFTITPSELIQLIKAN
jgi:hypothetical protein